MPSPALILAALFVVSFTLATWLQPASERWTRRGADSDSVLGALLGDGRRLFANHFFVKADVYFHGGFYPSIFDQQPLREELHMAEMDDAHAAKPESAEAGHAHEHGEAADLHHEVGQAESDAPAAPDDWIAKFGRHFYPSQHVHLEGGAPQREILPWLRLSAELDPQRVATYTVAAYWLRTRLGKVEEAEQFLREGRRANPDSAEILYELGRLYADNRKDAGRARNLWELALRKWRQQNAARPNPDNALLEEIAVHLAQLERDAGNAPKAIEYLEIVRDVSPMPAAVQLRIDELRAKAAEPVKP